MINNFNIIKTKNYSIYIDKNQPYYFVPNKIGDRILNKYIETNDIYECAKLLNFSPAINLLIIQEFLEKVESKVKENNYSGRFDLIDFTFPKEVWIHLTNRCNLNCSHCIFSDHLNDGKEIAFIDLKSVVEYLLNWGTNIFIFTGGEPLIYEGIEKIVSIIHKKSNDTKVAFLTNGINIKNLYKKFKDSCDLERLHFQLSCEGIFEKYEKIRGIKFDKFIETISILEKNNFYFTLGIDLIENNLEEIDFFLKSKIKNFHFFFHIPHGNGKNFNVDIKILTQKMIDFYLKAEKYNANVDNFYALKTQCFTYKGVKHDLTSAGIESFAIAPDLKIYPTAATIFQSQLECGNLKKQDLKDIWYNSQTLDFLRKSSVIKAANLKNDPFKFFHGGGDLDLSFFYTGKIFFYDPFIKLYNDIFCYLITEQAKEFDFNNKTPEILFEMGDKIEDCGKKGEVFLTHSNCLLTFATKNGLEAVQSFYRKSAKNENIEILNPFIENLKNENIPEENLKKSYGCGSPVNFAQIKKGDYVLDLGCGSGVETYIAADLTDENGLVLGIDMLEEMLELAKKGKRQNNFYLKSYIEKLPIKSNSFDVIISNCVINLSNNKKQIFKEIFRILKKNGRLCISDVIVEKNLPIKFLQDDKLRGECLSGALTEEKLLEILKQTGFKNIKIISRVPYREEHGIKFFSLTFLAEKKIKNERIKAYYPGPFNFIIGDNFSILKKGEIIQIENSQLFENEIFIFDDNDFVTNVEMESCCIIPQKKFETECLICGTEIEYFNKEKLLKCSICGNYYKTFAACKNGHFVCDICHSKDPLIIIEKFLLNSQETDLIKLFIEAKKIGNFPMHGPEYHALIPGIILTSYRNIGGNISNLEIKSAINRGKNIPGGSCGFSGVCGVVTGIGIALATIIKSTPLKAEERTLIQNFCADVLKEISKIKAARCCQRESIIGLKFFSNHSKKLIGISIPAIFNYICNQYKKNNSCIGEECPLFPIS